VSVSAAARAAAVVFVAAMLQIVIVSSLLVGGGAPDLLLVTVVALGLLRGSIAGAVFGFLGGLVVDVVTLDTLGITSLLLTLAGFWAGRYGETTGRDRWLAPVVAVGSVTLVAALFGAVLHFLLGDDVDVRHALFTSLAPAFVLNLLLALPVYRLVRATVGEGQRVEPAADVEVVL
jgi:rod shape-determining protein MreD